MDKCLRFCSQNFQQVFQLTDRSLDFNKHKATERERGRLSASYCPEICATQGDQSHSPGAALILQKCPLLVENTAAVHQVAMWWMQLQSWVQKRSDKIQMAFSEILRLFYCDLVP